MISVLRCWQWNGGIYKWKWVQVNTQNQNSPGLRSPSANKTGSLHNLSSKCSICFHQFDCFQELTATENELLSSWRPQNVINHEVMFIMFSKREVFWNLLVERSSNVFKMLLLNVHERFHDDAILHKEKRAEHIQKYAFITHSWR